MSTKPKSNVDQTIITTFEELISGFKNKEEKEFLLNEITNGAGIVPMIRSYFRGVDEGIVDYNFKKFDQEFFKAFLDYIVYTQYLLTNVINNTENLKTVSEKIKFVSPKNRRDGCVVNAVMNALLLHRYKTNFHIKALSEIELQDNAELIIKTISVLTQIYEQYIVFKNASKHNVKFINTSRDRLINVIISLFNNLSIHNYLLMYFVLWFYLCVVGDVSLILHHEGKLNEYRISVDPVNADPIVQTDGKPVILDPYTTRIKFDTNIEIDFKFWVLQDMFNIVMTGNRSKIYIIKNTPKEFCNEFMNMKEDGTVIYQQKNDYYSHTSLLFKINHDDHSYKYYNYDCVIGFNAKNDDDKSTIHDINYNDELIKFIGMNYGLLLFSGYPKPLIFTNPYDHKEITYSKFQKFTGGTIRNLVLIIILLVILVVIVIVIHNKFFKTAHVGENSDTKNI